MGKKENPLLSYYSQDGRFAELLNGWFFNGKPHWRAGDLRDADRRQDGRSEKGRTYRHKYRDLYKELDDALVHLFIGTELQEHVDYAMPLRAMDSDVLSYLHQKKTVGKNHTNDKDVREDTEDTEDAEDTENAENTDAKEALDSTGRQPLTAGEYLSRFSKADRLQPVITLILYCGEKEWDGARRLHELLDLERLPDSVKPYVADYPIHILDVCHTPDERLRQFPPDICFLLMCIKYAKDKEAFSRLRELTGTAVISADTCEAIAEYLGEPELLERGSGAEGGRNMCKAIRDLVEDGRNEGRLEGRKEGRKEGRNEGIQLAKNVLRMAGEQIPAEEIARELSITKEEVEKILE